MKVCFLDETTELDTLNDLEYRGRGGMVTSLLKLPDVLCKLGFECFVISDIKKGGVTRAGTVWFTKGKMTDDEKNQEYDFLVYNRQTCNGFSEINTKHRILWTHDIPHHGFIPDTRIMKVFDATVFMSRYAERIWRKYFPEIGRSFLIPNGVDRSLFYPREKDLNYIIFCSAPNRGLDKLPLIFEVLQKKIGGLTLRAYSNMNKLHPQDEDDYSDYYEKARSAGIEVLDPIPQAELAIELGKASLCIVPSRYPEICSNSLLQCLASGVPVLTSNIGSASEWIKTDFNGFLTEFMSCDYWVFDLELLRYAMELFLQPRKHKRLIKNASITPDIFSWEGIGLLWKKMFIKLY